MRPDPLMQVGLQTTGRHRVTFDRDRSQRAGRCPPARLAQLFEARRDVHPPATLVNERIGDGAMVAPQTSRDRCRVDNKSPGLRSGVLFLLPLAAVVWLNGFRSRE
jgi:hypothetical protein